MRAKSAVVGMVAAAAFSGAAIDVAIAGACPGTAPLTTYLSGGVNSTCTIEDKTFSDFSYAAHGTTDATGVSVMARGSSPVGAHNPGPAFSGNWAIGTASHTADFTLIFKVQATSSLPIKDHTVRFTGHATGTGSVIDDETLTFSDGRPPMHLVGSITAAGVRSIDVTFAPALTITVTEDVLLHGPETLSVIRKRFSEVPEPASLALVGVGLAALGAVQRRRRS